MVLRMWRKMAFILAILGIIQFIVLISIAMTFYAGGNEFNPDAPGYSFWLNSISDLGRTVAWSGKSNIISQVLLCISMILWGLSFVPSMHALSSFFSESRRRKLVTEIGLIFAFLCVFFLVFDVVLFPVDTQPQLHAIFAASSYLSLLVVEILYSITIFLDMNYPKKHALCFLAVAAVILIYFIFNNPISQKLISITITIATLIVFYDAWKIVEKRR